MNLQDQTVGIFADALMLSEDFADGNIAIISSLIKEIITIKYDDFADFKNQAIKVYDRTFKKIKQTYVDDLAAMGSNITDDMHQAIRAGDNGKRVNKLTTRELGSVIRQSVFEGEPLFQHNPLDERLEAQRVKSQKEVLGAVKRGINNGATPQQLTKKIQGILGGEKNAADRIARTTANAVGNNTLLTTFKNNSHLIEGVMHSTTLDSRTCMRCVSVSDVTYPVGRQPYMLPLHFRCRCVWVPMLYGDKPIVQTYEKWFASQPPERQLRILGPVRFELYKTGKVRVKDFAKDLRIKRLGDLPKAN